MTAAPDTSDARAHRRAALISMVGLGVIMGGCDALVLILS